MTRIVERLAVARAHLRRVAAPQGGFTLIELVVVMAVLMIILAPLTTSFASSMTAQVDQTRRFDAQENARQALDRMRKDIHCAHAVTDPYTNSSGGETLVLTETNVTGTAECPGLVETNASAVQWCTIPVAGATDRYQLYRENDADATCDGTASTFMVDYLTAASIWASPTCVSGQFPTVELTMSVDVDPTMRPGAYELSDQIALRNADICP
ncbi:MAG TPA: type II secretion system protein [Gaiellaceae bacterium]|jgi:prepilin-type N-terminal cleavage/methylation domain-containing protein